jgi:uncharacterized protein (DUF2384 family)
MAIINYEKFNSNTWERFKKLFDDISIDDERIKCMPIPDDIKKACLFVCDGTAFEWLTGEIPALDNSVPIDLISMRENGANIIRMVLLRMFC